jgi:hypothetical protein
MKGQQQTHFWFCRILGFSSMTWQDLVTSQAGFARNLVEEAIRGLACFDREQGVVLFTPNASRLQPRQRVLLFLLALQFWHLDKRPIRKPNCACWWHIKKRTCLGVEDLDLALMELRRANYIGRRYGRYFVRDPALPFATAEITTTKQSLKI